jgi:hypothetical protein
VRPPLDMRQCDAVHVAMEAESAALQELRESVSDLLEDGAAAVPAQPARRALPVRSQLAVPSSLLSPASVVRAHRPVSAVTVARADTRVLDTTPPVAAVRSASLSVPGDATEPMAPSHAGPSSSVASLPHTAITGASTYASTSAASSVASSPTHRSRSADVVAHARGTSVPPDLLQPRCASALMQRKECGVNTDGGAATLSSAIKHHVDAAAQAGASHRSLDAVCGLVTVMSPGAHRRTAGASADAIPLNSQLSLEMGACVAVSATPADLHGVAVHASQTQQTVRSTATVACGSDSDQVAFSVSASVGTMTDASRVAVAATRASRDTATVTDGMLLAGGVRTTPLVDACVGSDARASVDVNVGTDVVAVSGTDVCVGPEVAHDTASPGLHELSVSVTPASAAAFGDPSNPSLSRQATEGVTRTSARAELASSNGAACDPTLSGVVLHLQDTVSHLASVVADMSLVERRARYAALRTPEQPRHAVTPTPLAVRSPRCSSCGSPRPRGSRNVPPVQRAVSSRWRAGLSPASTSTSSAVESPPRKGVAVTPLQRRVQLAVSPTPSRARVSTYFLRRVRDERLRYQRDKHSAAVAPRSLSSSGVARRRDAVRSPRGRSRDHAVMARTVNSTTRVASRPRSRSRSSSLSLSSDTSASDCSPPRRATPRVPRARALVPSRRLAAASLVARIQSVMRPVGPKPEAPSVLGVTTVRRDAAVAGAAARAGVDASTDTPRAVWDHAAVLTPASATRAWQRLVRPHSAPPSPNHGSERSASDVGACCTATPVREHTPAPDGDTERQREVGSASSRGDSSMMNRSMLVDQPRFADGSNTWRASPRLGVILGSNPDGHRCVGWSFRVAGSSIRGCTHASAVCVPCVVRRAAVGVCT